MASDITNGVDFNKTNMKPDPDEEISALWGQNIADNTGYLYYKPELICNTTASLDIYNGYTDSSGNRPRSMGTLSFRKDPSFDTIVGTLRTYKKQDTGNNSDTAGSAYLYVDDVLKVSVDYGASITDEYNAGTGVSIDVSALSNDTDYTIAYKILPDNLPDPASFDSANLTFSMSLYGTTT